ncbi:ABC transporter permease subunit [candidate division KSB3 bacterium]|uniref:ABC transporter permease subunit n=1 Tax=candidate division KSB3 bacterium TaxID=2044937 RepID=A0A9D5Q8L5_9BACT|nr:ABC transporter permease subunit [candidate division KSB3 bacterium]MBD3327598.1 ABC transporter permease subunit [candidate division KSB3 bacterium]
MIAYILRRLLLLPIVMFILSALIFSLVMFLSPYERLAVFIPNADAVKSSIPYDELVSLYGLDKPFYIQYYEWLKKVFHGNLGWSPSARMPVLDAIARYFPATVELMLLGGLIIFPGGIFLGTYAATHHNRTTDQAARVATIVGVSLPEFIFGLFLLVIFYAWLGWFPPGRLSTWAEDVVYLSSFSRYTGMILVDALLNGRLDIFLDALRHLILPALAYSLGLLSTMLRMMRSSLLETLHQDYVTTARAKGLLERVVITKHARRNALLPVVTLGGTLVAKMLGGAVIVETVFNYRGMGMFIVTAAQGLDFSAILGVSLLIGLIIILTNLVIDMLYALLDPRIRLG